MNLKSVEKPQALDKKLQPSVVIVKDMMDYLFTGHICQRRLHSPENSILQEKKLSLAHRISLCSCRLVGANIISHCTNWFVHENTM